MKTNVLNNFNNYHDYRQHLLLKFKYSASKNNESLDQTYRRMVKQKNSEIKKAQREQPKKETEPKTAKMTQTQNIEPVNTKTINMEDVRRKIFEFANIIVETPKKEPKPEPKPEPVIETRPRLIVEEITLSNRVLN